MADLRAGGVLVLLAGIVNACFALPMKGMPRWAWENVWLIWSVFALMTLPALAAFATTPGLAAGYGEVDRATLLRVMVFGAAWGVAQVLFGLSVVRIGMALTFSLILGISAAVGTVVPFVWLHPELLLTTTGAFVWGGVVLVMLGMTLCAMAGRQRERELSPDKPEVDRPRTGSFKIGLLIAVVAGLCAAFMNLGISFAGPLLAMAARHGSRPYWQLNAVWLPLLVGGALPNVAYSIFLLRQRHTAGNFARGGTGVYWLLCLVMALCWFGSSLMYGAASFYLGVLGPVVGWPVFMSLVVIAASFLGWLTGEWRTATSRPLRLQVSGIAMLTVALFLFSRTGS